MNIGIDIVLYIALLHSYITAILELNHHIHKFVQGFDSCNDDGHIWNVVAYDG